MEFSVRKHTFFAYPVFMIIIRNRWNFGLICCSLPLPIATEHNYSDWPFTCLIFGLRYYHDFDNGVTSDQSCAVCYILLDKF